MGVVYHRDIDGDKITPTADRDDYIYYTYKGVELCDIGVLWKANEYETYVTLKPVVKRWDSTGTYNYGSGFDEALTEPNGSTGTWTISKWTNGTTSGWTTCDKFAERTYQRKDSDYYVNLTIDPDDEFGSYSNTYGFCYLDSDAVLFQYEIPALAAYTISYNANGGSGAPSSQTKKKNVALTLTTNTPTRTGYIFQGWATSSTGNVVYNSGDTYTSNSSITLYAVWKIRTYTISYNANGGSGAPSSQTKTYGVSLTLRTGIPTRTGYVFQGWAKSSTGNVAYNSGGTYTSNSSVTLYAVWNEEYSITYNANGGSGAPNKQTKVEDVDLTLRTGVPTRSGYTFKGWNDFQAVTSIKYNPGDTYKDNKGVVLYAIWRDNNLTDFNLKFNSTSTIIKDIKIQSDTSRLIDAYFSV